MLLSQLLREAGVEAIELRGDADITGITDDSRRVVPGACFVAIAGPVADGHDYISAAIKAGAAAVICEKSRKNHSDMAWATLTDTRSVLGALAQCFYGKPAQKLRLIGITGTKGKTTVSYICREILRSAGMQCGLIGTIECDTIARQIESSNTTPGSVDLAAMMAEMLQSGAKAAVMEVSSHGLEQCRADGIGFDAAVFTNLHSEHMDYHQTMDAYFLAKSRLFTSLGPDATAVINADDSYAARLKELTNCHVLEYSLNGVSDCYCRDISVAADGSRFGFVSGDFEADIHCSLIGRHNIYNCMAAAAACHSLGVDWDSIARTLNARLSVLGRLQCVEASDALNVYVDYAHTDDSLLNVMEAMKPLCSGRLIVLFGCGGDRDRSKRPRMARVAEDMADILVITNDNPRTEDPKRILDEIVAGLDDYPSASVHVVPDRREAIELSIKLAEPGDMVLLTGKGHETYQVIGTEKKHFDDAEVAAEVIASLPKGISRR